MPRFFIETTEEQEDGTEEHRVLGTGREICASKENARRVMRLAAILLKPQRIGRMAQRVTELRGTGLETCASEESYGHRSGDLRQQRFTAFLDAVRDLQSRTITIT